MAIESGSLLGGLKPPVLLSAKVGNGDLGFPVFRVIKGAGCTESVVSSSSLTEALNIAGGGVLTFANVSQSSGATASVSNVKIRIVIDGVTVLDEVGITLPSRDSAAQIVGAAISTGNGTTYTEGIVIFNKSLVVSIASDGVTPLSFNHKRYLT